MRGPWKLLIKLKLKRIIEKMKKYNSTSSRSAGSIATSEILFNRDKPRLMEKSMILRADLSKGATSTNNSAKTTEEDKKSGQ